MMFQWVSKANDYPYETVVDLHLGKEALESAEDYMNPSFL
jgi:hypothetical protein